MPPPDGENSFQHQIEALTRTKLDHRRAKLRRDGHHDIDDHGNIVGPPFGKTVSLLLSAAIRRVVAP